MLLLLLPEVAFPWWLSAADKLSVDADAGMAVCEDLMRDRVGGLKWKGLRRRSTVSEVEGFTEHGADDNGPVAQERSEVQA